MHNNAEEPESLHMANSLTTIPDHEGINQVDGHGCVSVAKEVSSFTSLVSINNANHKENKRFMPNNEAKCKNKMTTNTPIAAFLQDLKTEIQHWMEEGNQLIIGSDVNEPIFHSTIVNLFQSCGLRNLISELHNSTDAVPTYYNSQQPMGHSRHASYQMRIP
jgi:hypothetical protein